MVMYIIGIMLVTKRGDWMQSIKIVTDSAAHLSPGDVARYNITVMNSPILVNDKVFGYINQISEQKFHQLFDHPSGRPRIGEISVAALVDTYNQLGADGSKILSVHLSNKITHTYQNARQAAKRSTSDVTVINSQVTAAGLTYQVLTAAKQINRGNATIETLIPTLAQIRDRTQIYFSTPNNAQLVNQRIIGRFRGQIEKRLNISYIIQFINNDFSFITRSRKEDLATTFWDRQLATMHDQSIVQLSILHTGDPERADYLYEMLRTEFPFVPIEKVATNPEMACFIGSDATGVTYLLG